MLLEEMEEMAVLMRKMVVVEGAEELLLNLTIINLLEPLMLMEGQKAVMVL